MGKNLYFGITFVPQEIFLMSPGMPMTMTWHNVSQVINRACKNIFSTICEQTIITGCKLTNIRHNVDIQTFSLYTKSDHKVNAVCKCGEL